MPELTGIAARLSSAIASQYRVERELGVGGMATVFLAHDLKHDRDVAIKVLHPELTAALGGERFLSEIKTTARLQHPHILPLLDSGASDGLLYYVMPVVSGESLRARLTRERQLPIDDAIRITREVAAALDYAHRNGIIHRDIKPENILLHDGQALVADFGIALAVSAAGGERMTLTGISLGTPYYMSPEQAMGDRNIDARSDVYALGAVTYEMLAGEPPFTAPSPQAVLAKVITDRAPLVSVRRELVPPYLAAAIDKALAKLPADRFGSAAEYSSALADDRASAVVRRRSRVPEYWRSLVAIGIAAVVIPLSFWSMNARKAQRRAASAPTIYDVALPDSAPIRFQHSRNFAVSPAGDFVVYVAAASDTAATRLWYRSLLDATVRELPGTDGAFDPTVSPDGQSVTFFTGQQLKIVSLGGGQPRLVAPASDPIALRWISATRLFVVDNDGNTIVWIDPQVGATSTQPIGYCISPQWLGRDSSLLCGGGAEKTGGLRRPGDFSLRVLRPASGRGTNDWVTGAQFRVFDERYITYMSVEGDLRAASFDPQTLRVGRPVTLVSGIRREAYRGEGQYDVSATGTLVYVSGDNAEVGSLVRWYPDGRVERLPFEPAAFLRYHMTRDRRRVAAVVQGPSSHELRIYDARSGASQVWLQARDIGHPLWNASGDRLLVDIVVDSIRDALLMGSPDMPTPPETLIVSDSAGSAMGWVSNGRIIGNSFRKGFVWTMDVNQRPSRREFLVPDAVFPDVSPDGRLLSFLRVSTNETIVTNWPARNRVLRLNSGAEAQWVTPRTLRSRGNPGDWYEQDIDPERVEAVGRPRRIYVDRRFSDTPGWSQRVMADGSMIYVQGPARTSATYFRVVPNWVEQMKRAVDAANR